MADAPMKPPQSVVDYDAWNRGYTPPSEHVLIDQLAYRGARVACMSDWGSDGAFWVVMRGKTPSPAVRKSMRQMCELIFEDEKCSPETTSPSTSQTTTEPVTGTAPDETTAIGELTPQVGSTDVCESDGKVLAAAIGTQSKPGHGTI